MNRIAKHAGYVVWSLAIAAVFGWTVSGTAGRSEVEAGGAINNMMAVPGNRDNRMYLVDTDRKVILVYESLGKKGFSLVAGRTYELDREVMVKRELPWNGRGYGIKQIQKIWHDQNKLGAQ